MTLVFFFEIVAKRADRSTDVKRLQPPISSRKVTTAFSALKNNTLNNSPYKNRVNIVTKISRPKHLKHKKNTFPYP